jgi:hypothetical protein
VDLHVIKRCLKFRKTKVSQPVFHVLKIYIHVHVMSVLKNFVQSVSKKDGLDSQSVVNHQKMLYGYAVKTVSHRKTCANFHHRILNNLVRNDGLFSELIFCFLSVSIAKDTFLEMKSWISKIIFQFVRKKHGIEEEWKQMIEITSTTEFFKAVLSQTLEEQNFTFNRLYVLTLFTENICRKHPEISEEVQNVFIEFVRQIK